MQHAPWHQRIPQLHDYQRFENLVTLHDLTKSWLSSLTKETAPHSLSRGYHPRLSEELFRLDSLSNKTLEDLIGDTKVGELLDGLEHAIWAVQGWTLAHFSAISDPEEIAAIDSHIEQLTWQAGREYGQLYWKTYLHFAQEVPLQSLVLALQSSPLWAGSSKNAVLVKRSTQGEVSFELCSCPHQKPFHEILSVQDRLCQLHWQFHRGLAYTLNSSIFSEHRIEKPRCSQNWRLGS